jgi:hypothetical protein
VTSHERQAQDVVSPQVVPSMQGRPALSGATQAFGKGPQATMSGAAGEDDDSGSRRTIVSRQRRT